MQHGVNRNAAPGRCMVVGCNKKAIYQSRAGKVLGSPRGYCSVHRAYASHPTPESTLTQFADYIARKGW